MINEKITCTSQRHKHTVTTKDDCQLKLELEWCTSKCPCKYTHTEQLNQPQRDRSKRVSEWAGE